MTKRQEVLDFLNKIPKGYVTTYNSIAKILGINPRAVGSILRSNLDYNYPCFKVIKSDLSAGGYNKGYNEKLELLKKEGIKIENNKVSKECVYYF